MNRFMDLQEAILPRKKKKSENGINSAAKSFYTRSFNVPRGIRNNNPGNIEISKANDWKGKVPIDKNTDKRFEQFTDYKFGVRALIMLLRTYIRSGRNTITKIFSAYAPPNENNTQSYIKFVAGRLGIGADDVVTATKNNMKELAQAIAKMENGQEAITDAQFQEGFNELDEAIRNEIDPPAAKSMWGSSLGYDDIYYPSGQEFMEMTYDDSGSYTKHMSVSVKPKTITVVESSPNDKSQFLTYRAKGAPDSLRPVSTEDMVNKILSSLKEGEKIERLEIFGHGYDGYISVGAGELPEALKRINGNPEWEPHLKKLKGKFTNNAEVFLGGCHTGAGVDGANKLKKLADLWGVAVSASNGLVYANSAGAWWEETGAVRQRATPDKPAPKPLAYPSDLSKTKSMSDAESLSLLNVRNDITAIYLQALDKPLPGGLPLNATHQFKGPDKVNTILNGINFAKPASIIGLASIINARIFFVVGAKTEEFVVLGGYQFIAKKEDRGQAYSVTPQLRNTLKSLIEKQDFLNA
jgi:hypothetical protein